VGVLARAARALAAAASAQSWQNSLTWHPTDRTPASRWLAAGHRTCSVCGLNPSEPLARRGPPHLLGCGLNSGELLARHGSDPGEPLARRGPPHLLGCGLDSFLFVPDRHE